MSHLTAGLLTQAAFGTYNVADDIMEVAYTMNCVVAKFGGSSLADAAQFQKVKAILASDHNRRYVVPSAPGRRFADDEKITDLLYACYRALSSGADIDVVFDKVRARYVDIAAGLNLSIDIEGILSRTRDEILEAKSPDFAASRGEYLNGILLAAYLGWDFIDAAEVVFFDRKGNFSADWTNEVCCERLKKHKNAVIPGFYGSLPDGSIKTFSRGGSDITGALIARAAEADLYENWTDVSGFLMADPRVINNPLPIDTLTYRELRELSYMGATVLHEDAIFPVRRAGIPTVIKNTNAPSDPGTIIVMDDSLPEHSRIITGIAGRKGFTILAVEKGMMNAELGFGRRVLQALEEFGVSFEHMPTGIDTLCVVISDNDLRRHSERILARIQEICQPDMVELKSDLALIATVGRGMVRARGTAAKLFRALADADINVRMIDQGSSELNIIVGVDNHDFEAAVKAIYECFA